jgi:hypothetical protein
VPGRDGERVRRIVCEHLVEHCPDGVEPEAVAYPPEKLGVRAVVVAQHGRHRTVRDGE